MELLALPLATLAALLLVASLQAAAGPAAHAVALRILAAAGGSLTAVVRQPTSVCEHGTLQPTALRSV